MVVLFLNFFFPSFYSRYLTKHKETSPLGPLEQVDIFNHGQAKKSNQGGDLNVPNQTRGLVFLFHQYISQHLFFYK